MSVRWRRHASWKRLTSDPTWQNRASPTDRGRRGLRVKHGACRSGPKCRQAYLAVGLGFVFTAIIGSLLFGDALGKMRNTGITLIILGIVRS